MGVYCIIFNISRMQRKSDVRAAKSPPAAPLEHDAQCMVIIDYITPHPPPRKPLFPLPEIEDGKLC